MKAKEKVPMPQHDGQPPEQDNQPSEPEQDYQHHHRRARWVTVLRETGLFLYRAAPFLAAAGAAYTALKS